MRGGAAGGVHPQGKDAGIEVNTLSLILFTRPLLLRPVSLERQKEKEKKRWIWRRAFQMIKGEEKVKHEGDCVSALM